MPVTVVLNPPASADDGHITDEALSYPPDGVGAIVDTSNTRLFLRRSLSGGTYSIAVAPVRFDTSSIPDDATITLAELELFIFDALSDDDRSIVAEIFTNFPIDESDWAGTAPGSPIAEQIVSGLTVGTYETLPLASLAVINKTGFTGFRLHVSGIEPTGENRVDVTSVDGTDPPRLRVTYNREPTAPTVTSPNGGEVLDAVHAVKWNQATDPDSDVLTYDIELSTDNRQTWDVIASGVSWDAAGHNYDFSVEDQSNQCAIRIRAHDGATYGAYDESDTLFTIEHNDPPFAPSLDPLGNFDATETKRFTYDFEDQDVNDSQSARRVEIIQASDSAVITDTGKVATADQFYDILADTLTNETAYRIRVKTWDQDDAEGPWSGYQNFTCSARPTPTITDPVESQVIDSPTYTVVTNYSDPAGDVQSALRARAIRVSDSEVVHDIGKTAGSDTTALVEGFENGESYDIEWTAWDSYDIASDPDVVRISVVFDPPTTPTAAVTEEDGYIEISVTNPPPDTEPVTDHNDIFRRVAGTSTWVRIATDIVDGGTYDDYAVASGVEYEYKARAVGVNGGTADSATVSGSITLTGIWLHDVASPAGTVKRFSMPTERSVDRPKDVTLRRFAGRSKPVAEYGEANGRTATIGLRTLIDSDELADLEDLHERDATLCYRSPRGLKMFGVLGNLPTSDELRGATASVTVTETDHTEEV